MCVYYYTSTRVIIIVKKHNPVQNDSVRVVY